MSKHTPGPWSIARSGFPVDAFGILSGDMAIGQTVYIEDYDEHLANARLIAAAPEMLEACKQALRRIEQLDIDADPAVGPDPTQDLLKAVIAKAEGK